MIKGFLHATLHRTPGSMPLRISGYKMVAGINFEKPFVASFNTKDSVIIEYANKREGNYTLEEFYQYLDQAFLQLRGFQLLDVYEDVLAERRTNARLALYNSLFMKCCPCGHRDCEGSLDFSKNSVCLKY